jgi:hypothetical protein
MHTPTMTFPPPEMMGLRVYKLVFNYEARKADNLTVVCELMV